MTYKLTEKFYAPWQESFIKGKEYRVFSSKPQHSYKHDFFRLTGNQHVKWWNKPYFAIMNESSTVKFFLDAVINDVDYKEAEVYISKFSKLAADDVQGVFAGMKNYKYAKALDLTEADFMTVTISPSYLEARKSSLIHVKLVYEPNRYGKWKIYKIEETVCLK